MCPSAVLFTLTDTHWNSVATEGEIQPLSSTNPLFPFSENSDFIFTCKLYNVVFLTIFEIIFFPQDTMWQNY